MKFNSENWWGIMSFQKVQFKNQIITPVSSIQEETLNDNDFTNILKYLNAILEIHEKLENEKSEMLNIWNDIVSDIIGAIYSATSGFYRLSLTSLRGTLELACSSLYYFDHKIEYFMYRENDSKADKYVSTLVNEYSFFTTKYIKSFYEDIEREQIKIDSVSIYLKSLYSKLCDIVHGRYKTLTKTNSINIEYDKELFKRFENFLFETLSIIAVLYILRFNYKESVDLIELANYSKVVQF